MESSRVGVISGLVLDSSVVIAAEQRGLNASGVLREVRRDYGETEIALSVITVAELTHGVYRAKSVGMRHLRQTFIDQLCSQMTVYPLTLEIARTIGKVEAELAIAGSAVGFQDLAIGVTAMQLGFRLATLNLRHFQRIPGLAIVSL